MLSQINDTFAYNFVIGEFLADDDEEEDDDENESDADRRENVSFPSLLQVER